VPWGLKRFYGAGNLHFITASCYRRRPFLASPGNRDLFLRVLEEVRRRYQFVLVGYVVMPEHFHLLIGEPETANPSVVIQALKLGVSRRILAARKRRKKRTVVQENLWGEPVPQHFWQARFYDYNVWTRKKRVEKLRYIHRNPVRRGLVASPDQWQRRSFRTYALGEPGQARVNDWTVLKMKVREPETFGSTKPKTA
jgi:putative transposase